MSDSEGDFSDELLELAGATEKKRRKREAKHKSMKRRRQDASHSDTESEGAGSGTEGDSDNPYPLEGKYKDDADRNRLMEMSEIEREDILAQRQEEMQRMQDKRNLDAMLRDRIGGGDENVAKAAKRQHAQRGATKEKTKKLDELKARRKAKDEKKRPRTDSPKRDRSSSPMEMETSDEEEEDGQISKFDEFDDQDRRSASKANTDDKPAELHDLQSIALTRDTIVKHYLAPWFEDLVKGAWVRYCIGTEDHSTIPVYRACEIVEVAPRVIKTYRINDQPANQELILRHGNSEKNFAMDKISNSAINEKEFTRIVRVYQADKITMPSKRSCEKKAAQIAKLCSQALTEADVTAMIARRAQMNKTQSTNVTTLEKSRLLQARKLALGRNDHVEAAQIDKQLAALASESQPSRMAPSRTDELAKLNERNRRANIEAARKAEMLEHERKRRERKLAAVAASRTATPPVDRLAALKNGDVSRPGTPGTPVPQTANGTPRSQSPSSTKPADSGVAFEAAVLDDVEIDLGDF
ncbi:hypothetical protein PHLGIDRAFT_100587 [Phlebiopsis gigantea 11061_1 CR5-6]|uniref:Plus3 domain-containing protein n=1 Tax=Phlebiopsis gigantea (strain 11061_1 CR5-6) TaxID=745531 RepID=A0A0C3SCB9_PHLG1|nr:hypothetical protein PHLGIDRAFT_100587 [Phlebiopsis gigantea 11061_1 CR5-6]